MRKNEKGFTLIELIVVISIILIMIGFIVPKYTGYEKKVKKVKAINTAHVIQNAAIAAMADCETDEKIKNAITELTDAKIKSVEKSELDEKYILKIKYECDGKEFNLIMDMGNTSYTVENEEGEIYKTDNAVETADSSKETADQK